MALKPLSTLPETPLKIKRALLSVSDKSGVVELAQKLHEHGVKLISTGGTAKTLKQHNLPVTDVSSLTGFPECLDGRVKTLHPKIHGGILGRISHPDDVAEMNKLEIEPIELVVVNLYPFKETVSSDDVTPAIATENIDIGGPAMLRAAAKNFAHVAVLSDPGQYGLFTKMLDDEATVSFEFRRTLARHAFGHTADYDAAISHYMNEIDHCEIPEQATISLPKNTILRYGENPHQKAAVYGNQNEFIDCFHGKELSYNNYLDIDAALSLINEFKTEEPVAAIFKHTVPCGVGSGNTTAEAYRKAFSTDTQSPFGGIIIVNKELNIETATEIDKIFTEIILAPGFSPEAEHLLTQKKNRRLARIKKLPSGEHQWLYKSLFGGIISQQPDNKVVTPDNFKIVTKRKPTDDEYRDLIFAWKVVKHVKSNAIVYAGNGQTLGIGTGQTSRVDSSEIAVMKAGNEKLSLKGSVVASDAFFPFADGVEAAAKAGSTAVIQPGGSIRDEEVINAADEHDMAMIFTGMRHFRH